MSALSPRRLGFAALLAGLALIVMPACALAAPAHPAVTLASGSIFTGLAHALLGAFSWTVGLASKFVLVTLGALVRMLIPRSWAADGAQIMGWIVAVPDYAGRISAPGGGVSYGFAGVNSLRVLFMWLGMAVAPLTLTHATARAMVDGSEPVAIPVLRVLGVAAGILLYPYLWAQAANLADQLTHLILALPAVTDGLVKLMDYAVDGVALGGWQLIDLGLMGAIGVALLGLIFMKVVLVLLGALLYATGPLMIGLVPTRGGHAIARAWLSAVMFLLGIGIGWAALFAVGAVLIQDAGTAGPLLAGNSAFGHLIGGLILAVSGLAALWLCLKITREAGGILRMQLGGMLALGTAGLGSGRAGGGGRPAARTTGASLRRFASGVSAAGRAAGDELAEHLPAGTGAAVRSAAGMGRRGLVGTAALHGRQVAGRAAGPTAAVLGGSRAGAVAVAMARRGTAAYAQTTAAAADDHRTPAGHHANDVPTARTDAAPAPNSPRQQGGGGQRRGARPQQSRTEPMRAPQSTGAQPPAARPVEGAEPATAAAKGALDPRPRLPVGGGLSHSDVTARERDTPSPRAFSPPPRADSPGGAARTPGGVPPRGAQTSDSRPAPTSQRPTRPSSGAGSPTPPDQPEKTDARRRRERPPVDADDRSGR